MKVRVTITKTYELDFQMTDEELTELVRDDPADFFDEAAWTIERADDEVQP